MSEQHWDEVMSSSPHHSNNVLNFHTGSRVAVSEFLRIAGSSMSSNVDVSLVRVLSSQMCTQGQRNPLVSHSSPGPRGLSYALGAGRPRAVDPMGGELAEGAPPGWGRIAPRAGAGCSGSRGSRGSWWCWEQTSDLAPASPSVARRVLRERSEDLRVEGNWGLRVPAKQLQEASLATA